MFVAEVKATVPFGAKICPLSVVVPLTVTPPAVA